jgi:hypothetical protein
MSLSKFKGKPLVLYFLPYIWKLGFHKIGAISNLVLSIISLKLENVALLITPTFFFVDYRMWPNYTTLISCNLLATNNLNVYPTFVYQLFHWNLGAYACYYWVIWSKWNNWPLPGITIVIIAWKIWFDSLSSFFCKIWGHQLGFHGHNIGSIVNCELLNQVH